LTPPFWLVLVGPEPPAIVAMLDCLQRPADHLAGGADDRASLIRWLVVAILPVPVPVPVPVLLGYGILLGYYFAVIRRNMPGSPAERCCVQAGPWSRIATIATPGDRGDPGAP
jgi:hypothetical protein